eukprot:3891025-Prymnesium_polylepis.1
MCVRQLFSGQLSQSCVRKASNSTALDDSRERREGSLPGKGAASEVVGATVDAPHPMIQVCNNTARTSETAKGIQ